MGVSQRTLVHIVTSKADRFPSATGMVCRGHGCSHVCEEQAAAGVRDLKHLDLFFLSEKPRLQELKDVSRRGSF